MSDADQEGDTFPYLDYIGGVYNNFLTDVSYPASTLFNPNTDGSKRLGKPITNIDVKGNGLAAFDILGGGDPPYSAAGLTAADPSGQVEAFGIDGTSLGRYPSAADAARSLRGRMLILRDSSGKAFRTLAR